MNQPALANVTPLSVAKPTPSIVHVSPEMADRWLKGNGVNRSIREGKVNRYAADMLAGRWTFSNDAICFSPSGRLLNGQHRLTAIIKSGVTLSLLIMRGIPESAMGNMDTGSGRTAADHFGFQREPHASLLASSLKFAVLYMDDRIYRDRAVQDVSRAELSDFLEENADLRESVAFVGSHTRAIDLTPTAKAVSHWLCSRAAGTQAASEFFFLLNSRTDLPPRSPILALDSRLRELRRGHVKTTHRDQVYLVIKAWNHWRRGKSATSLALRGKGGQPGRIPPVAS